jgi:hypothetical protein
MAFIMACCLLVYQIYFKNDPQQSKSSSYWLPLLIDHTILRKYHSKQTEYNGNITVLP